MYDEVDINDVINLADSLGVDFYDLTTRMLLTSICDINNKAKVLEERLNDMSNRIKALEE